MPTAVQDKIDERAGIWDKMTKLMDAHDSVLPAEKIGEYAALEKQFDDLETVIDAANRHAKNSANVGRVDRAGVVADPAETGAEQDAIYERVFASFLATGMAELEPADKKILIGNRVDTSNLPKNAAGVGTLAGGGYAVPPLFRETFVEALKYFGPMLDVAEVIYTASGASLPWPTNDDTGNMGAILAENTQVTEQDVTLGTNAMPAFMYTSKLVRVSFQMINDVPGFETWLARKLGERVGRILNNHWTVGVGTTEPQGFVTGGTVRATGAGSIATLGPWNGDNLIDLVESLDPAYGQSNNLMWQMHQSARGRIRKLKDTQGRYLFEPSIQNGVPDLLLGYGLKLNNDMPTVAINSKSVAFGDWKESYVARIVNDLAVLRLTERYADFLQVGFLGFERAGGVVQNTASYGILQSTPTV